MSPVDPRHASLERLVRSCGRRGWTVAYSLLRHHDDAMDAVQQALLVASRKPDRIPTDDPWPWFGVVVAHEARNIRRKRRPVTNRLGEGPDMPMPTEDRSDPTMRPERDEERRHLRAALETLPERERDAVVLTHLVGMSHALAAEALDVPRPTLSAQARRGLDRLAGRLRREPDHVVRSLGLLPIAAPRCGWEAATATWTEAAVGSLSAGTAATGAALGGLALMASKTALVLTLAVVAGMGFLGGALVQGSGSRDSWVGGRAGGPDALEDPGVASGDPSGGRLADEDAVTLRGSVDAADLQREVEDLRDRLASAQVHRETLERRLAAFEEPSAGPTFTFGRLGQLDAVTENNWMESGRAARVIAAGVRKALAIRERGEAVPDAVRLEIQESADRMRKYEFRAYGKMPTAAKYNGENTHPITAANLLAAMLADAGLPLTADQVKRIDALGVRFEDDYEDLLGSFTDAMPRVERLLAEYRIKGRFIDDAIRILTPEQRRAVVPPETYRVTGLDIVCPTEMIAYTSPILVGTSMEKICGDLRTVLARKLSLDEAGVTALEQPIAAWAQDVRDLVQKPVSRTRLRHYTYAEAELAGQATVLLAQRLLEGLDLSAAQRQALMTDDAFYIPRLVTS